MRTWGSLCHFLCWSELFYLWSAEPYCNHSSCAVVPKLMKLTSFSWRCDCFLFLFLTVFACWSAWEKKTLWGIFRWQSEWSAWHMAWRFPVWPRTWHCWMWFCYFERWSYEQRSCFWLVWCSGVESCGCDRSVAVSFSTFWFVTVFWDGSRRSWMHYDLHFLVVDVADGGRTHQWLLHIIRLNLLYRRSSVATYYHVILRSQLVWTILV